MHINRNNKFFAALLAGVMVLSTAISTFAEGIGYVDMEKINTDYQKANELMADIKVKEAELRKMQADFVKQLEESRKANAKSPVANEQLEKDLNAQLTTKANEFRNWAQTRQTEVNNSLMSSVSDVAKTRGVSVVIPRQFMLYGGVDLTSDVLAKLNAANR